MQVQKSYLGLFDLVGPRTLTRTVCVGNRDWVDLISPLGDNKLGIASTGESFYRLLSNANPDLAI
jgi:hypothetical protein